MRENERVSVGELSVTRDLFDFVNNEIIPDINLDPTDFWADLAETVDVLGPRNRTLLDERDRFQDQLDEWHRQNPGPAYSKDAYKAFLTHIGYLVAEGPNFQIKTDNVDPEISTIAGPQLVVPVGNARYAVNAVNARWGSLYDALYTSDVIPVVDDRKRDGAYDPIRGALVVGYAAEFLDRAVPLQSASHADVVEYRLVDVMGSQKRLDLVLSDARITGLIDTGQFVGYENDGPRSSIVLRNNYLHMELLIDRQHPVGCQHPAGLRDVVLEAAVTTIQDFEDAESAIDSEDKIRLYRSWLGLMKGTLEAKYNRGTEVKKRKMADDKVYRSPDGSILKLSGRSLLLVRNVGIHMYTDIVKVRGNPIPEGFLDAYMTSLIAMHDLQKKSGPRNSAAGSVYIVKPKMHGPDEVSLVIDIFERIEGILGLPKNSLKIGIMDEERRMTVNLKEAIRVARDRLIFINTGFLDRTGDEIHTGMEAGPMLPKSEIKGTPWIKGYEDSNVDIGIATGIPGKGQIGKGMWAAPDAMKDMLSEKKAHPAAGATTAWVPSPRAAVLHAMHYHDCDVSKRQFVLSSRVRAKLDDILTFPLLADRKLSANEIQRELENNAQGILGYVVRWIQKGVGCSKVLDIDNIALMEDRATLRISSQHIANWLYHNLLDKEQIITTFKRMAAVVDGQNLEDSKYQPMAPDFDDSPAFQVALELVFGGRCEPNGYTESALHRGRYVTKRSGH